SASDARTAPPLAAEHPVPASGLPPRSGAAAPPARPPSAARVTTEPAPSAAAPRAPGGAATEQATAAWMLTTYGRADAESRARGALKFSDPRSAEGRCWRRVLALIVASRCFALDPAEAIEDNRPHGRNRAQCGDRPGAARARRPPSPRRSSDGRTSSGRRRAAARPSARAAGGGL